MPLQDGGVFIIFVRLMNPWTCSGSLALPGSRVPLRFGNHSKTFRNGGGPVGVQRDTFGHTLDVESAVGTLAEKRNRKSSVMISFFPFIRPQ